MRLIAALLLISQMAVAQDQASPEYRLVDLLGGKAQLTEIHQIVIDNLVRADPSLDEYRSTIEIWTQHYLGWEEVREQMAGLYRKYFTAAELSEMLAFYSGPTGRKVVLLTPTLLSEANEIGARLTRAHKEELIAMLRQARAEAELP